MAVCKENKYFELVTLKHILSLFQVDLQTFMTLTDEDLKELGFSTFGPRKKILTAIQGEPSVDCVIKAQQF